MKSLSRRRREERSRWRPGKTKEDPIHYPNSQRRKRKTQRGKIGIQIWRKSQWTEKPVEEKEAETKPVTRGSKEQDSETTTPKEQKEDKDKEGEEDEEETQAVIHYEYGDMYSKPIVSSLPQDTLQFLYPPLI